MHALEGARECNGMSTAPGGRIPHRFTSSVRRGAASVGTLASGAGGECKTQCSRSPEKNKTEPGVGKASATAVGSFGEGGWPTGHLMREAISVAMSGHQSVVP